VGVPDCAAEVVNRFRDRLAVFGDTDELLDALTPPLLGERLSYRQYVRTFERAPHLFLPSAQIARSPASGTSAGGVVARAKRRLQRTLSKPDTPAP
jgi:hypothetical protein